jgi:hypothetical protein
MLEDRVVPSTFTVMNLNDSGATSLRGAIAYANTHNGTTIDFHAGLHGTITLASELEIQNSMSITGPGAGNHANGSIGTGGGVFTTGFFVVTFTTISGNHASTSGDNIGP